MRTRLIALFSCLALAVSGCAFVKKELSKKEKFQQYKMIVAMAASAGCGSLELSQEEKELTKNTLSKFITLVESGGTPGEIVTRDKAMDWVWYAFNLGVAQAKEQIDSKEATELLVTALKSCRNALVQKQ